MQWSDFLTAIALVMVLEGIMPFLNPAGLRETLRSMAEQEEGTLRLAGLLSMVSGVVLLYFVK